MLTCDIIPLAQDLVAKYIEDGSKCKHGEEDQVGCPRLGLIFATRSHDGCGRDELCYCLEKVSKIKPQVDLGTGDAKSRWRWR